ncbi:MAG: transcriptional regulator [Planctomycetota bacterium]|jgi:DNA-binding transcriptional ArsR family regulator
MTPEPPEGRYSYDRLDRVIHERARLGILTSLVAHADGLPWGDLKALCSLTDGNLSRHLKVLTEAGLVSLERETGEGRPQTRCRMTPVGRQRFVAYLAELERVVKDAMEAETDVPDVPGELGEGWSTA